LGEAAAFFKDYEGGAEDAAALHIESGGVVLGILTCKEAHKMAIYLIGRATNRVVLTAFTYDLNTVTEALIQAAQRGIDVTVIVDKSHSESGATLSMPERLGQLRDGGAKVYTCRGATGSSGIQHSKTLLVDDKAIIGSANWTNSSRSNDEVSMLVWLGPDGLMKYDSRIDIMKDKGKFFDVDEQDRAEGVRSKRTQSVGAARRAATVDHDKYRTARRFSIANSRLRSASQGHGKASSSSTA